MKFTVTEGLRPSGAEAAIWYDDGDLAAEVHGNLGTLPDPIEAMDLADLFVTAVNSHDALVEALTAAMEAFDNRYDGADDSRTKWMGEYIDQADAALKLAGK